MNNYYVPIKNKMKLKKPNEQKDLLKTAVCEQGQARNTVKQNTHDFESSI